LGKEEAIWKRMLTGLKYDNTDMLKLIFKQSEMAPFHEYCRKQQNQRASDYLRGLGPDAEAEKKRQKAAGRKGKK
jgi:hypothetical protein